MTPCEVALALHERSVPYTKLASWQRKFSEADWTEFGVEWERLGDTDWYKWFIKDKRGNYA